MMSRQGPIQFILINELNDEAEIPTVAAPGRGLFLRERKRNKTRVIPGPTTPT